eukprot:TRINITY_DN91035_c0_g1_i1.p1 TRINITY_DN91035_c0_g1~~TRINITY_DN91035_c0_g1_i1.p1  ORF type:complete len:704 (-),score=170.26 TRINITY_DN91035_c0_g1_i1:94-2205(-)
MFVMQRLSPLLRAQRVASSSPRCRHLLSPSSCITGGPATLVCTRKQYHAIYRYHDEQLRTASCHGRSRSFSSSSPAPAVEAGKKLRREELQALVSSIPRERNRNFSIIAHVDHGKSTLCDRMLQTTGVIPADAPDQFLDGLEVEKARGITVKAQTCSMLYRSSKDGELYLLNLIDTPGHVDFSYEVSRSLKACQGAVLLVDAVQGVQAQTVSTFHQAFDADLEMLCALSKIDLEHAQKEDVKHQLEGLCGVPADQVLEVSGKTGKGVPDLLEAVIANVPMPVGDPEAAFKALLFDAYFDGKRGVVLLVAVHDGYLQSGKRIYCSYSKKLYNVQECGILHPDARPLNGLGSGQVGFIVVGAKDIRGFRVGETVWADGAQKTGTPFEGFRPAQPMVYAGIFPESVGDGEKLESAMQRLLLEDASVDASRDISPVLGAGFRCGFLGLLHLDIFCQRLQSEHGVAVLATSPTVPYRLTMKDGKVVTVEHAGDFPSPPAMPPEVVEEPMVRATIVVPRDMVPDVQLLCLEKRGEQLDMEPLDNLGQRMMMKFKLPQADVIRDFFDRLQSTTHGYASFDYEPMGYETVDLVKIGVKLNGDLVDALSFLATRERSLDIARAFLQKLAQLIPAQQFDIFLQAVISNKVVAKERIKPLRKDVIAQKILSHGHSGDPNRKMKLLEKQKEGKKKLREISNVQVPPEAFVAMVKL